MKLDMVSEPRLGFPHAATHAFFPFLSRPIFFPSSQPISVPPPRSATAGPVPPATAGPVPPHLIQGSASLGHCWPRSACSFRPASSRDRSPGHYLTARPLLVASSSFAVGREDWELAPPARLVPPSPGPVARSPVARERPSQRPGLSVVYPAARPWGPCQELLRSAAGRPE
jgi:hypothetical protein